MAEDQVKFTVSAEDRPFQTSMARVESTTVATTRKLKAEWAKYEKDVAALQSKSARGAGAGGGGTSVAGALSMQVQDIAVQAQMGVDPLRVLAQQGSQIASIFGPAGAVVGGIIATAAALGVLGKEAKDSGAELAELQKKVDFQDETFQLQEQVKIMRIRASLGEEAAEHAEREAKFRKMGQEAAKMAGTEEYAARLKAIDELADAEERLAVKKKNDDYYKEVEEQTEKIISAEKQLGALQQTNEQQRLELSREIGELAKTAYAQGKTSLEVETARAKMAEKMVTLANLAKQANEENIRLQKQADNERKKYLDYAQNQFNAYAKTQLNFYQVLADQVKGAIRAQKELKREQTASKLEAFNKRVENRQKSPQERADERREARSLARAQRAEVRRDLAGQTLRDPVTGRIQKFEQMGGASRDALVRQRMGAINSANEASLTDLTDASIQKLADALSTKMTAVVSK